MSHHATPRYAPVRLAPLLTIDQTAAILGVVRATVFRLLAAGELQAVRVGQRRRIRPEDLDAYIESRREPVDAA